LIKFQNFKNSRYKAYQPAFSSSKSVAGR